MPEAFKRYMKAPKTSKKVNKPKRSHFLLSPSCLPRTSRRGQQRGASTRAPAAQSIMRRFKKIDTGPEKTVRAILLDLGVRFRVNDASLPGTPDIVFPHQRKVIFVHGCFWHQHGCHLTRTPKGNSEYWMPKFARNRARDRRVRHQLRDKRWKMLVIWECQIRESSLAERLAKFIKS
jgi:DNA mismatch endonuclease (patch repair protein)